MKCCKGNLILEMRKRGAVAMADVTDVGKWKSVWMCNGFVRILRHLLTATRAEDNGALG